MSIEDGPFTPNNMTRRHPFPLLRSVLLTTAAGIVALTCGGRSALEVPPPLPPQPECNTDTDCPGHDDLCQVVACVDSEKYADQLPSLPAGVPLPPRVCLNLDPVLCDDEDPCTEDSCEPTTGDCTYAPVSLDLDGDGHYAPRPGTEAGDPDACGDDCNDASADAYPGAQELCDGFDNDCNGVVDDDADFIPLQTAPTRISGDIAPAGPGGLAFNGQTYLSTYTGTTTGFDMYTTRIDDTGTTIPPVEQQIAVQNADSSGGPVIWIGDRYGLAWQDRRDGNYEAYFALLDGEGSKVVADTRLSFAVGFSVNVHMAWNGTEFIVVWQDNRVGVFDIMAQRVSVDGVPQGENVQLSPPDGFNDESPSIASGNKTVGVAFANGDAGFQLIRFQTFEQTTLTPTSSVIALTDGSTEAVYPTTAWNNDHYVVAWYDRTAPLKAVYAATISESGEILTPATAISAPGTARSRYPKLMPLGDRTLVLYADDRDQNSGYELYARTVDTMLAPLSIEKRLTDAPFDSIYPTASFGPEGNVGILFRDDREAGDHHVWFTQLGCTASDDIP